MRVIEDVAALEAIYGAPSGAAVLKVTDRLIPGYRSFVERSRFCVLSTVGPEGTDATPRGDDGPVVAVLDERRLAMPDWRGNNRIDTLRNVVRDPRVSLMFFVPGSTNVMRINGAAVVTDDPAMLLRFEQRGRQPRTALVVQIHEVYPQCARAIMRAGLWTSGDESAGLPSIGDMMREASDGTFDGAAYDADWPERAKTTMW